VSYVCCGVAARFATPSDGAACRVAAQIIPKYDTASCGGFVGHVKLTFGRGTSLTPVPPMTPIGMGKESRGVDLESLDDLDETQIASWMRQATAIPGFGGKKR
jgi:hypothetical protein